MKDQFIRDEVPFSMVARELLNDPSISLKAKGVYAFMYGKPKNWNFTIKSMKSQLKEGYRGISTALLELKEKGWVTYTKNADGTGVYYLHVKPKTQNATLDQSQNRVSASCANSIMLKRDRIKERDLISNKDLFSDKEPSPKKTKKEFDPQVSSLTRKLSEHFPEAIVSKLTSSQKLKWIDTVDKLLRLDKFTAAEIEQAVKNGRKDRFWETNFLSINKLRNKNRDGLMYIQVFLNLKSNQKLGAGDSNYVEGEMTKDDLL